MLRPLLFTFIAVVMLFALETLGATERVVTFDDLPKLIKERNENVQAAEASLKASKARTGFLTRSFLPQISGSVGNEEFKTGSVASERKNFWAIHGRINLYRGGRDRLENEIRKSNEKRSHADYAVEVNSELKEARQAYWKLVAISKIIADRKEALDRNESFIKGSRKRAGAGVATNADALQFELQKTLLSQDLKKLTLEEDLLRNQLAVAIGLDEHENLRINGDFQHPPEELTIAEQDAKDNLEVKRLTSIQTTEGLKRDQASRWWLPKLDVYSKYGVPSLDDEYGTALRQDHEFSLGVILTLDLGEGLESRTDAQARSYEAIASEKRADHRLREVKAQDHELRHDLKLLHELIHDADRDIEKSEQFLKLTQSEYSRGVKNGPDLLDAVRNLYEFRERRTALYREYYETHAELAALTAKE
jgi:outer membrane protein TolC